MQVIIFNLVGVGYEWVIFCVAQGTGFFFFFFAFHLTYLNMK